MKKRLSPVLLMLLFSFAAFSQPAQFSVKEMIEQSDNIFIGTVDDISCFRNDKGFPLTKIVFKDVEGARSASGRYEVQIAGGQIGDTMVSLSHSPIFNKGERYLVFASDPSKGYANPIIGRYGLLKVIGDKQSSEAYLVSASNRCLVSIKDGEIKMSRKELIDVEDGVPAYLAQVNKYRMDVLPTSSTSRQASLITESNELQLPMSLKDFRLALKNDYGLSFSTLASNPPVNRGPVANPQKTTTFLSVCGYQQLPLLMKQIPVSITPWYSINNQCMNLWNQVMSIYSPMPTTGTFGHNDTSEFGGFASGSSLSSAYGVGFNWGPGTIAVTVYFWAGTCNQIWDADVFVNPGMSITDNIWDQVSGKGIMYRAAVIHELGHVWGLMDGVQETYDYDVPTVMQGGTYGIYEDGMGIHAPDAMLMRYMYASQTPVQHRIDLGIESYYALQGLHKSTMDSTFVTAGSTVYVKGMTVENISADTVENIQVRFYLSTDSIIAEDDYVMPDLYAWGAFNPVSYINASFEFTVPEETPPGTYYVGAVVSKNGVVDSIEGNNVTVLNDKLTVDYPTAVKTLSSAGNDVSILPTGVRGSYNVIYKGHSKGTVRVFSVTGQKLLEQDLSENRLQLPDAAGIYLAEVITGEGRKLFKLPNY